MFGEDKFLKDLRARHKAARTPVLKEEVELEEEFVDLEEATVYVKKRYNSLGANQFSNQVGFAKKINNAAQKLGLTVKMEGENLVISGDPEKIASMKKTVKGVEFSMKEDLDEEFIDLEEAVTELVEGKIAYIYENTTRTRNKIVIVAEAKVKDENIGRFQETFIKMALKQSESLIKDYREGLGTTKNDDDKDFKKAAKEVAEKANAKVNVKFFGGLGRVSYKEMTPAEFKKKLEAEVRYSGRSLKGGYFTRYLTSYFKYLIREYNSYITMTKAQVETNIEKGFWEAETELEEGKSSSGYELYHDTFSSAMKTAYDFAKSKYGITVDPEEIDSKVATGPKKPSAGKTNSYSLKGDKGTIQVQVYNMDNKKYELNVYKS